MSHIDFSRFPLLGLWDIKEVLQLLNQKSARFCVNFMLNETVIRNKRNIKGLVSE